MIKPNGTTSPNVNTVGVNCVRLQNARGITLIALIITIIVMLILAGVSISIAINGGLFDATKQAVKQTENAVNIEQQLADGRVKVGETWYDSIEDYINDNPSGNQGGGEELPVTPPVEPENPPVIDTSIYENALKDETTGVLLANATYTSDGKTAIVPSGFKIIDGIEGTKSINAGLVIQDKDGNEFVWIPVEVTESDTETEIASFYRSKWANNARSESLKDSTTTIEPYKSGYTGEEEEYAEMVKSVYKNHGFYIGRYEAGSETERTNKAEGNGTTKMVVKKDQFVYNYVGWGASLTDYTSDIGKQGKGAVYLSKQMYNDEDVGVKSALCYGVQWDAMLDFIKGNDHNVTDSSSWGNYKQDNEEIIVKSTGSSNSYAAKNIYDVAGNVWETTMEYGAGAPMRRGGGASASTGDISASARTTGIYANNSAYNSGFRVTLIVR